MNPRKPLIRLKDVYKVYGEMESEVVALNNVNLVIYRGEMLAIVGTSGAGKSSLMNILGCITKATSGRYLVDNEDINTYSEGDLARIRNEKFGFVLQSFGLIDDYTVRQNIMIPLAYAKQKNISEEEFDALLRKLKIADKKNADCKNLSNGQKQRVAIARALINRPEIILADEPTGALDSRTAQSIMDVFKELNAEGKTVIIVTHDMNIARQCGRLIEIKDGQVVEIPKPPEPLIEGAKA